MANPTTSPKGKEENRTGSTQPMEKAKENAGQAMDKAKGAASSLGDMASNAASAVGQGVTHAASAVGHSVSNAASAVGQTVSNAASATANKADDLTSSAGAGIRHFGETLRQNTPREGMLGSASQAVAGGVTSTGRYIEEAGLSGMMEDLTEVIRRNPLPAVLVGVGVGVLIGRMLRS